MKVAKRLTALPSPLVGEGLGVRETAMNPSNIQFMAVSGRSWNCRKAPRLIPCHGLDCTEAILVLH